MIVFLLATIRPDDCRLLAGKPRLRGPGPIVEPSRILAARPRGARRLRDRHVAFSKTSGMVRTCGNGGKPHRDQRQFRPAREGEASILSDQVGPTAGTR